MMIMMMMISQKRLFFLQFNDSLTINYCCFFQKKKTETIFTFLLDFFDSILICDWIQGYIAKLKTIVQFNFWIFECLLSSIDHHHHYHHQCLIVVVVVGDIPLLLVKREYQNTTSSFRFVVNQINQPSEQPFYYHHHHFL